MLKVLSLALVLVAATPVSAATTGFWDTPKKGTNFFAVNPRKERFQDAAKAGILLARLAPNKWLNGRSEAQRGDFLLGPKDHYEGIVQKDLQYLIHVLDDVNRAGLKVVLTMLSLPGSRWLQHNCVGEKCTQQYDLWKDFKYHSQAAVFWRDLARALKGHPAIVGYNILNEPCPERANKPALRDWYTQDYASWYKGVKGTPADLNLFYRTVSKAIREVDAETPIVVDSGFYANPYALQIMEPATIGDGHLIYALHHYEPAHYATSKTPGRYTYPGIIPTGELDAAGEEGAEGPYSPLQKWDHVKIGEYFKVVTDWATRNHVPSNRIYLAEFGAYRDAAGVVDYFRDHLAYFNKQGWHWSFYSYREDDSFPKMDFELGTGPLNPKYWECGKAYTCQGAGLYRPNALWGTILDALRK